jgi:GNAT superfamily N-acetyltransferase
VLESRGFRETMRMTASSCLMSASETADQFRERAAAVGMIEDACFVAATAEAFVGYSALTLTDESRLEAGSGGTAVRPEYRGFGIATALKASCIRWAAEHGVRCLATSSGNPAMIRVNEKFGFRRTHEEVRTVGRL